MGGGRGKKTAIQGAACPNPSRLRRKENEKESSVEIFYSCYYQTPLPPLLPSKYHRATTPGPGVEIELLNHRLDAVNPEKTLTALRN